MSFLASVDTSSVRCYGLIISGQKRLRFPFFRRKRTAAPSDADGTNVREMTPRASLEELNAAADKYYAQREDGVYFLAKPLAAIHETPLILIQFGKLLQGLQLLPDHHVLDFGAGSCWTSRWMTQLGCKVFALDVSAAALRIGARLFEVLPVVGDHHPPVFLPYDGRTIPLADESVDRICCFDAFHHVVNPEEVLREMARVLRPGGIAGFAEPGPNHSRLPQSLAEMEDFKVIENDIIIEQIGDIARQAGFSDMKVALFDGGFRTFSVDTFNDFVHGSEAMTATIVAGMRDFLQTCRIFFLAKGEPPAPDSRTRVGLTADIRIDIDNRRVRHEAGMVSGLARVKNSSPLTWLPATTRVGAVHLGCHLLSADGQMISYDFFRTSLTPGIDRPLAPGEEVEVRLEIPVPPPGACVLEFDMVSEWVCWFSFNGSPTVKVNLEII